MNWIDLLIVGIVAWTTFVGFSSGLIRQMVWLIAILLGILLAGALYDDLAANLDFVIDDATTRNLIAFGAIVGGAVVAGTVIGQVLKTTASLLMLGPLDHIGGAVLGLIRGVIYVQVALFALAVYPDNETLGRGIEGSALAPFFLEDAGFIGAVLPSEFDDPLEQLEGWRERLSSFLPGLPEFPGGGDGVPASSEGGG
ncbi:MAG: CvpA family protein [Dehalococcoidia bacterium]